MGQSPSKINAESPDAKIRKQKWNPITQLLKHKTIISLKNKWVAEELDVMEERVKPHKRTGWTQEQFFDLFPRLKGKNQDHANFSSGTRERVYKLFHRHTFERQRKLTNEQILQAITLITKSDSHELLSRLVFYLYNDQGARQMSQSGYNKFIKENMIMLKDQKDENEVKQWINGKEKISPEQFFTQFQKFDMKKYIDLFQPDYSIEEKEMVKHLKFMKKYSREVGTEVYLVDFNWFLHWKDYIYDRYGIEPKIVDKDRHTDRSKILAKSKVDLRKSQGQFFQHDFKAVKRPGVVPNWNLVGDEETQLRNGMKEFVDYIMVPKWLWDFFKRVYRGHPDIKRLYPQIYTLKFQQVFIDKDAKFIPKKPKELQLVYQQMRIRELFMQKYLLKDAVCMYKYSTQENWKEIEDYNIRISDWKDAGTNRKFFICIVEKSLKRKFIERYNVMTKGQMKYVKERIKNYATLLYVPVHGVLRRGFVMKIGEKCVWVEYRNEENSRFHKKFQIAQICDENLNLYPADEEKHMLSGFSHKNNFSYLNALIQCLIRTPLFGKYLEKVNKMEEDIQMQSLVIWALAESLKRSSALRGQVTMDTYRQVIMDQMVKFQKFSKSEMSGGTIDPYKFLKAMLYVMEKQFKGITEDINPKPDFDAEGERNIVIEQFFQTQGTVATSCKSCGNYLENTRDIYTHSLELPEDRLSQYHFYLFPKNERNWKPVKYGVDFEGHVSVQSYMKSVLELTKMKPEGLKCFVSYKGQLLQNLKDVSKDKNIIQYVNLGYKLICYEIVSQNNIFLEVRTRKLASKRRFKTYGAPLLIQIFQQTTWKDVANQIDEYLKGHYMPINQCRNIRDRLGHLRRSQVSERSVDLSKSFRDIYDSYRSEAEGDDMLEIKSSQPSDMQDLRSSSIQSSSMRSSSIRSSSISSAMSRSSQVSTGDATQQRKRINPSYDMRITYKDKKSLYCFKCGKQFVKVKALSQQCKGACIKESSLISEDPRIHKHLDQIMITIDWVNPDSYTGLDTLPHPSVTDDKPQCVSFQKLLAKNPHFEQADEEPCQKCQQKGTVSKKIIIQKHPNILIIQLKRFVKKSYGIVKKKITIDYPKRFLIQDQQYDLFGVFAHRGVGMEDGYYNYVKCDNYDQWFKCNETRVEGLKNKEEIRDPNAYILFYKKTDMDPVLKFYNPLI